MANGEHGTSRMLCARLSIHCPVRALTRIMRTNTAAVGIVGPSDHGVLWEWMSGAPAGADPVVSGCRLSGGRPVAIRARWVKDNGVVAGALLWLDPPAPAVAGHAGSHCGTVRSRAGRA
jgi:hypothetical protein